MDTEEFVDSLIQRNANFRHFLRNAVRIRPWRAEGDYSYRIETLAGKGWLLIGDALRFVDPVFSTGVDVACYSALYAFEAIDAACKGEDEKRAFGTYARRVSDGVEAWYDLTALFYELQNLFTYFAIRPAFRERVVRILQGNLYQPDSLRGAREMISMMQEASAKVATNPSNLLRPGALTSLGGRRVHVRAEGEALRPEGPAGGRPAS
jgi:FADH2 O2-dependent halogenase